MLTIVPFRPEYALSMTLQDEQAAVAAELTLETLGRLAQEPSWAAIASDGEVIACAGVTEATHPAALKALQAMAKAGTEGAARKVPMGWGLLSAEAGPHMTALTRVVRHFIETGFAPAKMVLVRDGFAAGGRWASMVGFRRSAEEPVVLGGKNMLVFERAYHG